MLCVTGSWDEVIDWMEKYTQAGARTVVLRFARVTSSPPQACAEALARRGLLVKPSLFSKEDLIKKISRKAQSIPERNRRDALAQT